MNLSSTILGVIILFTGSSEKAGSIEYEILATVLRYERSIDEEYDQMIYKDIVLLKSWSRDVEFPLGPDSTDQGIFNDLSYYYNGGKVYQLLKLDPEWLELINIKNNRSDPPSKWENFTISGRTIVLLKKPFVKKISKKDQGWDVFYHKYPESNGFFTAGKPIIQGNKALIYVGTMHGRLDGVGKFYFLEKRENWEIIVDLEIWVA